MKEEHDEDKPNPKISCSKSRKSVILRILILLTILVVAITLILIGSSIDLKLEKRNHEWKCGNVIFPLLIDGVSVKFHDKFFTPREIELLKTRNGASGNSTYQIFMEIDQMTRDCQFEYGSFTTRHEYRYISTYFTYTGMHLDGVPWGVGKYEDVHRIVYSTIDEHKYHGF